MILLVIGAALCVASVPLLFLLVLQSLVQLWREWWKLYKRLPRIGW